MPRDAAQSPQIVHDNSHLNLAGAKICHVKRPGEAFSNNDLRYAAAALAAAAAALYHLHTTNLWMPQTYSDLLPRIVGARDALRGLNPYSAHVLHDIQRACYGRVLRPGVSVQKLTRQLIQ